jgi:hypothetical protein
MISDPKKAEALSSFNRPWRHEAIVGYGELHSTVNDLLKYVSANLGLTPSSLRFKTHRTVSLFGLSNFGSRVSDFLLSCLRYDFVNGLKERLMKSMIAPGAGCNYSN